MAITDAERDRIRQHILERGDQNEYATAWALLQISDLLVEIRDLLLAARKPKQGDPP